MNQLEQVYSSLRTYKRERAALILREHLQLTPLNGKYTAQQKAARACFESAVLAIKPG